MGNVICSSCMANETRYAKVIYWEGNTKTLKGKRHQLAGEIMFQFPESIVCDADRFFIGHPIPSLSIEDQLKPGKTYFVLPLDIFPSEILSASSISIFIARTSRQRSTSANLKEFPLEYIKKPNGRVLIKVKPEFMARILSSRSRDHDIVQENRDTSDNYAINASLCSTPELKKEYEQLVRSKDHIWSPSLDSISEAKKIWYSPYRFLGSGWQEKEEDGLI